MEGSLLIVILSVFIVQSCGQQDTDHEVCKGKPYGYFANNPVNCHAYWICINNIGHAGQCAAGFNFNEQHQLCDRPENSPCIECPSNGIHFIGVETSCTQYHFCFQGGHTLRECPNGLQFDFVHKTCDQPEIAKCEYRKCPPTDNQQKLITYSSVERCEDYYICNDGRPERYQCNSGIHWNQAIQQCDLPQYANCTLNDPVIICPDEELHFIPHPRDCSKYFICIDRQLMPRTCPSGLLFDPQLLQCNLANAVTC